MSMLNLHSAYQIDKKKGLIYGGKILTLDGHPGYSSAVVKVPRIGTETDDQLLTRMLKILQDTPMQEQSALPCEHTTFIEDQNEMRICKTCGKVWEPNP